MPQPIAGSHALSMCAQPHSLCNPRWQNTPFCPNWNTPDISIILLFTFYQPVFYATYDQYFQSESEERAGYWVSFGEHCGDAMTHKLLDHETQKIIYRTAVKPQKSSTPNHRLAPHGGEVSTCSDPSEDKNSFGSPLGQKQKTPTVLIRSRDEENPSGSKPMPTQT